jgi:hypothetical protein
MKSENIDRDPQLIEALRSWQVNEPLPPHFHERVWKRIDTTEAAASRGSLSWLSALLLKPAFATAVAALLLVAGLTAGYLRSDRDTARWEEQLAHRYVTAMNPYAAESH